MNLLIDRVASAIGTILIISDGARLCALDYSGYERRMMRLLRARYGEVRLHPTRNPAGLSRRVRAYLAGTHRAIDDVAVDTGGTPFQRRVWSALRKIPVGQTLSYGGLAERLGMPAASRAVGRAVSLNPVAIVVPCHRVIGADGTLTGYAGGLDRKRWLLAHEGAVPTPSPGRAEPARATRRARPGGTRRRRPSRGRNAAATGRTRQ
ncbi:MAG TPA: methylated-DNA--[protein]-cysteine S-methyltransferase [bacterium]|nr:methylated-DNA--[protein]-cysteine S-methyltransferase [bacterium]